MLVVGHSERLWNVCHHELDKTSMAFDIVVCNVEYIQHAICRNKLLAMKLITSLPLIHDSALVHTQCSLNRQLFMLTSVLVNFPRAKVTQ